MWFAINVNQPSGNKISSVNAQATLVANPCLGSFSNLCDGVSLVSHASLPHRLPPQPEISSLGLYAEVGAVIFSRPRKD